MPVTRSELPDTIKRSPRKAQRTYAKTLENAHKQYRSEERAHRTAMASLKQGFEKVGDHWEPKKSGKGPSDPQSKQSGRRAREHPRETFGGLDFYGHTREELYRRAKKLGIEGRSRMNKKELAEAIARKQ